MSTNVVYDNSQSVIVHKTTNYKMFKPDLTRPVDPARVARLVDALSDNDFLAEIPIIVQEDFTVNDGRHRLRAAEILNLPIFYIVTARMKRHHVPKINNDRSSWSSANSLYFYTEVEPNSNYVLLNNFWGKYRFLKLKSAIDLCYYGSNTNLHVRFQTGLYQFNDGKFGEVVANRILDIRDYFQYWNHIRLVDAISNLSANSDYNHERFMRKLRQQPATLKRAVDMNGYIEQINKIYNHGYGEERRVLLVRLYPSSPKYRPDRKGI